METAVVNRSALLWKKLPFSRRIFKSFIRKSTYRSAPWVIHDKLAQKHGISNDLPQVLKGKVTIQNGLVVCNKKRKNVEGNKNTGDVEESGKCRKKKVEGEDVGAENMEKSNGRENEQPKEEPIKYPIDDLLVQPGADDPVFAARPSPTRDFKVQMECFGDLLMVWDFCSSFGRLLHLWPFSLENFENAICHKDSNLILIVETHSALLRLLLKDKREYLWAVQNRSRKLKVKDPISLKYFSYSEGLSVQSGFCPSISPRWYLWTSCC
uniref:DDT domain-containing protein DDB_G0282237 isoform X2 n=2 Tax=Rhizophora mucronata TaxID=61149 RepID=A0A2P2IRA4_RHIMU